jgi:hypothetical protein
MILVREDSGFKVRPGDVVRERGAYPARFYTVAGWDPETNYVHVWSNPDDVGDMRLHKAWSPHFLGLRWIEEEA